MLILFHSSAIDFFHPYKMAKPNAPEASGEMITGVDFPKKNRKVPGTVRFPRSVASYFSLKSAITA